jgi:SAM-dependent methyltransferase
MVMQTLMNNILGLTRDDVFLDIGHGIGNTCLQAALTAGCEARGIEVVFSRNSIAGVFRDRMFARHQLNSKTRIMGEVKLRHGRLEDESQREFLTKGITRAFVNNFNGVFAERSVKLNTNWFLDDYVSGIFALLVPGAILVTLHPLNLGPTQEEANAIRRKHDLTESLTASFFKVERLLLGEARDTVKWNQHSGNLHKIYIYKYTRVSQGDRSDAVFLCCNPSCQVAKDSTPIRATTINDEGRCVINQCECKFTAKNLRRQDKKTYVD